MAYMTNKGMKDWKDWKDKIGFHPLFIQISETIRKYSFKGRSQYQKPLHNFVCGNLAFLPSSLPL
jgi:hypothetical protein